MKVQNFFSGRLVKAEDLQREQTAAREKQSPPGGAGGSPVADSFERAGASPLSALLSPRRTVGAGPERLVADAMAQAFGDPSLAARAGSFAAAGPQIAALPEFPAVVELGRRSLLGDGAAKEGFLGGLGRLATSPGVDSAALLFHTFSGALGAAVPALLRSPTPSSLGDEVKLLESRQEEVRNRRNMDTTAFQDFDQKSNQLYDMLSAVVKTMNEMRGIGAGSRSGL